MSSTKPIARTFRAAWLVLGAWLAMSAPWLVMGTGCHPDAEDRPAPETSQGDEFGGEIEPSVQPTMADPTVPIDTNNPEERTPTVTAPPALPPATETSGGANGE